MLPVHLYTHAQNQRGTHCDFLIHSVSQTPKMLHPTAPIVQHSILFFVPPQQSPFKFKQPNSSGHLFGQLFLN